MNDPKEGFNKKLIERCFLLGQELSVNENHLIAMTRPMMHIDYYEYMEDDKVHVFNI